MNAAAPENGNVKFSVTPKGGGEGNLAGTATVNLNKNFR